MVWHIGNTTLRNPYRIVDGLRALVNSEFHGNLLGKEKEGGYANLLFKHGIVRSTKSDGEKIEGYNPFLGRKWRGAAGQLGFLTYHMKRGHRIGVDPKLILFVKDFPDLTGRPYEITPNGRRLLNANSIIEKQECFLRSLLGYRIPSIIEKRYDFHQFSPLRYILEILIELENNGEKNIIKLEEMAAIVEVFTPNAGISNVINRILLYREKRNMAKNKKRFDNEMRKKIVETRSLKIQPDSLSDYADLTFRYFKATGLFQSKGHGIVIMPEKKELVNQIVTEVFIEKNDFDYLKDLWEGSILPTDDKDKAMKMVKYLSDHLISKGEKELIDYELLKEKPIADISQIRYKLEKKIQEFKELKFSENQQKQWQEIAGYMKALINKKKRFKLENGKILSIPKSEAPAYFEWIIWRAFLAINSLDNYPWEARRFEIDQDFFPLHTAPGRGPDMIFEFENFVLVVEVTLTSSSRQEAVEGEPVRRHVAKIAEQHEKTGKRVYCLFIAINIDSNTAETFKIGSWYKNDDTTLPLQIVPIPLKDFIILFEEGMRSAKFEPEILKELLIYCRSIANNNAPVWKRKIREEVKITIQRAFT